MTQKKMAGPEGLEPSVTVLETVGLPINRWTYLMFYKLVP